MILNNEELKFDFLSSGVIFEKTNSVQAGIERKSAAMSCQNI